MRDLLIEASGPYASIRDVIPNGLREEIGSIIPSPAGTTVRYDGAIEYRSVGIEPTFQFLMDVGAQVTATLIAAWLIDTFRGRTEKITIDRHEVDLDDEGQVWRIVDERIKVIRK